MAKIFFGMKKAELSNDELWLISAFLFEYRIYIRFGGRD
jgi:hypothetical protein